jgi:predicted bacteriocin transport accessory protein
MKKEEFISKETENSERKNLLYAFGIGFAFFALMILLSSLSLNESKKILQNFEKAISSEQREIIYIGRDSCIFCQYLSPILRDLVNNHEIEYTYVDADKLTASQLENILSDLKIDLEQFGTPYLIAVENGIVEDRLVGFNGEAKTFEFFQRNNKLDFSVKPIINYIKVNEFVDLLNQSETEIIVIGATNCDFCSKVRPTLIDLIEKHNLTINYYNINIVEGDDYENEIQNSLDLINSNIDIVISSAFSKIESFGTPTMFLVRDRKIVAHLSEAVSLEVFENFLKENGVL